MRAGTKYGSLAPERYSSYCFCAAMSAAEIDGFR